MNTRTTAAIAAGLLAATLTACGSSDDKATAPETTTAASQPPTSTSLSPTAPVGDESAALKAAVAAYTDAYFAPDPDTAHRMLSARCQTEISQAALSGILDQAAVDYGQHKATGITVDQQSGDLARVTYGVEGLPKFDQKSQPWVREGGQWRYDAC
ncbi:hypothetical protein OG345_05290 [Streptomyces sp. NBC_01220]|uniref:hypothetical protein n=1 Tax=Streptomyces sp. NBC_01220 TaxID=2903781 RepID=UPI00352EF7A6|nr:hypothetical protein OG345_05290 [Streptomyces sp. NBC_01220]